MSEPGNDNTQALAALEHFVVDNDELLELEERIGRFNLFDALRIDRTEIRHSNFLAWLLDPDESHGQGPLFLRAVLMDLLKTARENGYDFPVSPIDLDGAELRGVTIRREWKHIDLLITCDGPGFVIAIENKVDSSPSNPFDRYEAAVRDEFPRSPAAFVYLTPSGVELDEDNWTHYSYADIFRVLGRVRRTNADSIGDDVLAFLDHYLRLIGSRFMDDPKIDALCQRIYKNHRQAIELIVERGRVDIRAFVDSIRDALNSDADLQVYPTKGKSVCFIPKSWLTVLPSIRQDPPNEPEQWFCGEVRFTGSDCDLWFYACPTVDADLRETVIRRLIRDPDEFGFELKRKKASPLWATIYKTRIASEIDEEADTDDVTEKAVAAVDELKSRADRAVDAIQQVAETWSKENEM